MLFKIKVTFHFNPDYHYKLLYFTYIFITKRGIVTRDRAPNFVSGGCGIESGLRRDSLTMKSFLHAALILVKLYKQCGSML